MRLRRRPLPDDAEELIAREVVHWRHLDADEREALLGITEWLLRHKTWEAARGFALDDTIRVVIAAQAALLILGLSTDHYHLVTSIIVHPAGMTTHGERAGLARGTVTDSILPIHGLAQDRRGPVLISWNQAIAGARHPEWGHNVVLHEFAHKIDMLDGIIDGTPPLARPDRRRWVDVCTEVYESVRAGEPRPPLRAYGGTNPAEFFAVATEAFFDRAVDLSEAEPDLYDVLRAFYVQDPAARCTRA
ncbi:zinc-dependent peptidase [Actinospongicola halichondriae]|uniref:M90 family metallopeptidase n=1 Tax=Actinospongicola halichondriae TaxID=3236844 RepID=UPI003D59A3B6